MRILFVSVCKQTEKFWFIFMRYKKCVRLLTLLFCFVLFLNVSFLGLNSWKEFILRMFAYLSNFYIYFQLLIQCNEKQGLSVCETSIANKSNVFLFDFYVFNIKKVHK